jgi:hypothetical protein
MHQEAGTDIFLHSGAQGVANIFVRRFRKQGFDARVGLPFCKATA